MSQFMGYPINLITHYVDSNNLHSEYLMEG